MNKLNLRGRRFGRLLVIEECAERKRRSVMWKCQCDCGNIAYVSSKDLQRNKEKSCGCKGTNNINHVGKTYGKMKVLAETAKRKRKSIIWNCQCEYCGSYKELSTADLIQPTLDGCGCKRAKHIRETNMLYQGTSIRQITDEKNRKNNTSGVKGVYKHKKNGTYIAYITLQRKQHYLGSYMTLEEAKQARKQAEEEMYKPIVESYKKEKENERI